MENKNKMPVITFTQQDIKSSHIVEKPDWYEYEIKKVSSKPAKTDGSANYWVTFRGLNGEMEDVLVTEMWSSKAGFAMVPLYRGTHGGEDPKAGDSLDFNELVGIKLRAMTVRGDKFGSIGNCLKDFRPLE